MDVQGSGGHREILHVYCVVGTGMGVDVGPIGLDGRPVSAIHHLDLAALVSPAPVRAYTRMQKEELIAHLFAHQAVMETILAARTVVPVKFGTTVRDAAEVRTILAKGYPQLRAALEAMGGKIELDVVAVWRDLDSVLHEVGAEAEIQRAKAALRAGSPEETREERGRIGQMVKAGLDRRREELAVHIGEALAGLAQAVCPHARLDDRMILNTAVLVERSREAEVGQTLERLNGRWAGRVDFRCVGPLPPYSFSTVEIRRFVAEEVTRARRLLGLGEQAGGLEAKTAYRRLAHRCHPDKGPRPQGTGERFDEATEAYRMLAEYYAATEQGPPSADARDVVAVKLVRWDAEAVGV